MDQPLISQADDVTTLWTFYDGTKTFVSEHCFETFDSVPNNLLLFRLKGTTCAHCKTSCHRLILGRSRNGYETLGLYSEDLKLQLTRGHIIPSANRGSGNMSNLRPLCNLCNVREGSNFKHLFKDPKLFETHCLGKTVRAKNKIFIAPGHASGVIAGICRIPSPDCMRVHFIFEEGFSYPAKKVEFL